MNMMNRGRTLGCLLTLATLAVLGGCAKATVMPTKTTFGPLPKPDMIVVYDFAVSADEVRLDSGVMKEAMRNTSNRAETEEEIAVGHAVANKLSEDLVAELRKAGIAAARASKQLQTTDRTAFMTGQFVTVDQGNQTARNWVGFGLGGTELRTRIQIIQGGNLIAEGETRTRSNLKPGMLVSAGLAVGAESVVPVVVGATGAVISEKFTGTLEADAARTADEVAKRVEKAYQDRGWLP